MNSNGLVTIPHARKRCSTHSNHEVCDNGRIGAAPPSPGAQESSGTDKQREKQQSRGETNVEAGRVKWKEKLWGGFKNGHIWSDRSKLRPTGLENRTHKFRTLNMFYCFLLPSLFSLSLSFFSSAGKKINGTHTLYCRLSHFLNQDNEPEEETDSGTSALDQVSDQKRSRPGVPPLGMKLFRQFPDQN